MRTCKITSHSLRMLLLLFILILTIFTSMTTSMTVDTQEERRLEDRIAHATCCELAAQHIPILRAWNEACLHVPRSADVEKAMLSKFISLTHLHDNKSIETKANITDKLEKLCNDSGVDDFSHHLHESAIELYIRGSVFCSSLPHHHKELVHSAAFVPLVEAFPSEEDLIVDGMETTCKEIQENRRNEFYKWVNVIVTSSQQSQKSQEINTSIAEVQNMLCDAPCKQIVDEFGEWRNDLE